MAQRKKKTVRKKIATARGKMSKAAKPPRKKAPQRLRIVHRIDKETSGLVVFARTVEAERGLGRLSNREQVRLWPVVVHRLAL